VLFLSVELITRYNIAVAGFSFLTEGKRIMKKIHRAVQKGHNKWERKTGWKWDAEDFISAIILIAVAGYVIARAIIG
jgi:hypothetical protein